MATIPQRNLQTELNRMAPAARDAMLGDIINDLVTSHNAVLAQLDAATGAPMGTSNAATLHVKTLAERAALLLR